MKSPMISPPYLRVSNENIFILEFVAKESIESDIDNQSPYSTKSLLIVWGGGVNIFFHINHISMKHISQFEHSMQLTLLTFPSKERRYKKILIP